MKEKIILRKYADVGTATPWVARCMNGMMHLREIYFKNDAKKISEFDNFYNSIWVNLLSSHEKKEKIINSVSEYADEFRNKKNFSMNGDAIEFYKDIDKELNDLYKGFIIDIYTAVKDVQKVTKYIGFNIGFFYGKDDTFEQGILKFLDEHKQCKKITDMLRADRKWYSLLNKIRVDYVHNSFNLPGVRYDLENYEVLFPQNIFDVNKFFNNSWVFIEELIIYFFDISLTHGMRIMQIPESERDPNNPIKYVIGIPGITFQENQENTTKH